MIHFLYRNEILVGLEGLQKIKTQTSTFSSSFWVLCIHVLKISVLLLRELPIWLYKMCFFSFRQTLHFLVVGLNILPLSIRPHLISYSLFSFFNCQIWIRNKIKIKINYPNVRKPSGRQRFSSFSMLKSKIF